MEGFFQKITYYDLYGYTFPGCILVLSVLCRAVPSGLINSLREYHEGYLYIFIVLLVLSFIVGIMVSEIGYMLWERGLAFVRPSYLKKAEVPYEAINSALNKSLKPGKTITVKNVEDLINYMPYMYSVIQVDQTYGRIHNYASTAIMCRNLALVSVGSGLILYRDNIISIVIGGIVAVIFAYRSYRFNVKKEFYTIYWFINKYEN